MSNKVDAEKTELKAKAMQTGTKTKKSVEEKMLKLQKVKFLQTA